MKIDAKLMRAPLLALALAGGSALAEPVTIISGAHTREASAYLTSYSAQCPSARYELKITNLHDQMLFVVNADPARTFDVSTTQFGKTFLHRPLFGRFAFGCGNRHAIISFMGVEMQKAGQPKPVSYYLVIGDDGKVAPNDGGLQQDSYEVINSYLVKD